MMKRSGKRVRKKIMQILCVTAVVPAVFYGIFHILPQWDVMAANIALISAGTVMPEGGGSLLTGYFNSDAHEPSERDNDGIADVIESGQDAIGEEEAPEEGQTTPPERPENAGTIVRKQYGGGTGSPYIQLSNNAYLKNVTTHSEAEVWEQINQAPAFTIEDSSEPQVLIMHTHTTEGYEEFSLDWYDPNLNSRTTNLDQSVVRVADEICKQLDAAGIGYIHDTTVHDYPTFPGCYDRSAVTVANYLAEHPTIKVVIDVHRDAIEDNQGVRYAPVAEIDGKNAAQVMIISGCDDGTMNYPNYFQNLKFAARFQQQMEGDYPGLTRPLLFDYRKYNQHLTTGSILLEMGSHGNSLEEAVYAGELVGKSLANTLNGLKE